MKMPSKPVIPGLSRQSRPQAIDFFTLDCRDKPGMTRLGVFAGGYVVSRVVRSWQSLEDAVSEFRSANELKRETVRLMRRMVKGNGHLERGGGTSLGREDWQLMVAKNRYRRPVETIDGRLVQHMFRNGWLQEKAAGLMVVCADAGLPGSAPAGRLNGAGDRGGRSMTDEDGRQQWVTVNDAENPLNWLLHRRDANGVPYISQTQLAAAEILRRDYTLACMEPRVTFQWSEKLGGKTRSSGGASADSLLDSDRAVAARQRLRRALDALGPEKSRIAVEICCMSRGIENAERTLGHARRTGRRVLLAALDELAVHYRLAEPTRGGSSRGAGNVLDAADHRGQAV